MGTRKKRGLWVLGFVVALIFGLGLYWPRSQPRFSFACVPANSFVYQREVLGSHIYKTIYSWEADLNETTKALDKELRAKGAIDVAPNVWVLDQETTVRVNRCEVLLRWGSPVFVRRPGWVAVSVDSGDQNGFLEWLADRF